MDLRLVACPSCSNYVKREEPQCIICGAQLRGAGRVAGRTVGAVLMGLSMTACPADDTMGDSMATDTGSASDATSTTMAESLSGTSVGMTEGTESITDPGSESTTFDVASAYGVPGTGTTIGDSETATDTDTDTATDTGSSTGTTSAETGSTSISPDYGVPDTSP
jgi:hypothetical protein